jgi:hypothetical protein
VFWWQDYRIFGSILQYSRKHKRTHFRNCTNSFYVRLHNFYVYVFLQHVSVVYDHHQVAFTCTLTPVFLLFLPTLANVYIWRYDVVALYDKINWNIKTYKLKLLKLLKLLFLHVHFYTRVITHVERLRWTVDTSTFELLNNCSELETMTQDVND